MEDGRRADGASAHCRALPSSKGAVDIMAERNKSSVFVKTPVLVQDTYSVEEIAILFRVSRNSVYEWHKREDDPLPLRRMNGKKRGFFAYRDELLEWSKRNAV